MSKSFIDNVHALQLKFYATQWRDTDKKLLEIREKITRIRDSAEKEIMSLQFKEGELYHQKRVAELEMTKIILAQNKSTDD